MYSLEQEKRLLSKLASSLKGKLTLDVGCGTGVFTSWLSVKGAHAIGIDISLEMLTFAKRKHPGIAFILADACSLPFKSESFDLVISVTSLNFIENPEKAAGEAKRVLKEEGKLVVGVLNSLSVYAILKRLRGCFSRSSYRDARFFTPGQLMKLIDSRDYLSAVHAPEFLPAPLLRLAARLEPMLSVFLKPFGAFIASAWEKF
jgi:ubiquinone/menaquinone biosynthesis C-methylase UbiE